MINRLREIIKIWEQDRSAYPQTGPVRGFFGFRMRLKCSICILLGLKTVRPYSLDIMPVWVGPLWVDYANPGASWTEIGVTYGWRNWRYASYGNGV